MNNPQKELGIMQEVVAILTARIKVTYVFLVDYQSSFRDYIVRGQYDFENKEIDTTEFPPDERKENALVKFRFFFSEEGMTSKEAIEKMAKEGCRPATRIELLAFGEANPELSRYFPINALGSQGMHPRYGLTVCEIWSYECKCRVSMNYVKRKWDRYCLFLAVVLE